MIRLIAAAGALVALGTSAPTAWAAEGDVTVSIQSGAVECLLSADAVGRGGGQMAVCQRADGSPFGQSFPSTEKYPVRLPMAVLRGTGQFYWDGGNLRDMSPVTGDGPSIGSGQTYRANGWTVTGEGPRTRITNDASQHGLLIYAESVRSF